MWLTAFLLSSSVAAYFIYKIWGKWNTTPVLVTFNDEPTPVWNIPFPAVTICPHVKLKKQSTSTRPLYRRTIRLQKSKHHNLVPQCNCSALKLRPFSVGSLSITI